MEKSDRLELLEQHLSLAEAVARAVAYGSPSPVEEYRASVNQDVLALRHELNPDADENVEVEDPAEEEDAFEDRDVDPDIDGPGVQVDSGSAEVPSPDLPESPAPVEVVDAPAVVLPPAEVPEVGSPAEDAPVAPAVDAAPKAEPENA